MTTSAENACASHSLSAAAPVLAAAGSVLVRIADGRVAVADSTGRVVGTDLRPEHDRRPARVTHDLRT